MNYALPINKKWQSILSSNMMVCDMSFIAVLMFLSPSLDGLWHNQTSIFLSFVMTFPECFMNPSADWLRYGPNFIHLSADMAQILLQHNAWSIFLLESCCIIFYKFFSPHKLYSQATISRDDSTYILNVFILCWQKKVIQIWDCLGGSIFLFEMMVVLMIICIRIWYVLINFFFLMRNI